jgi:hypothetical protein
MEEKANPIPERGERNFFCPYYSDCLDFAVEGSWRTWNCSRCPYKLLRVPPVGYGYEFNTEDTDYDLPPGVGEETFGDLFD